jgi:hypothetical protein
MVSNQSLSSVVGAIEVQNYNARLATMDHLIGCAERHDEPENVRELSQTMDSYARVTALSLAV